MKYFLITAEENFEFTNRVDCIEKVRKIEERKAARLVYFVIKGNKIKAEKLIKACSLKLKRKKGKKCL